MRVSCNAYFAQLGVAVGPRALRDTAAQFGIVTSSPDTVERLRGQLPWASYGQAEVLASPFTMARVAATFANDGVGAGWRRVVIGDRPSSAAVGARPDACCSPEQARRIGAGDAVGRDERHGARADGRRRPEHRRQDRHGGSHRRAVAFVVRRLRAGVGGATSKSDRVCRDRGEWRLRRVGRRAGGRRGRGGRAKSWACQVTASSRSLRLRT